MKYEAEYTDTFGGEANYCWVRRAEFEAPENATNRQLLNHAKKALDIQSNFKLHADFGEMIRYDEICACRCLFITVKYV